MFVAVLLGAAALAGSATATAAPLPLEAATQSPSDPVAGGLCNADPVIALWCLLASPSA
ncbi:Uncharacterised protein [Nocardia africana]|uniref:Secreted protein n=2 Tax=Nocardia africana TaxID=134964 RepID=A0A378WUG1_9NOCA|nr:Uncharacterised protein [Nocardia africana]